MGSSVHVVVAPSLHQHALLSFILVTSRAKILCSGSEGGAIQVWNLKSGELLHTLQTKNQGKSCSVKSISAGPNGKVVSTYDQTYVQCDCVC